MNQENEEIIFAIILHAGNARAEAYAALATAGAGDFAGAAAHLAAAEDEAAAAHRVQADIIAREVGGETQAVSLLLVHAQDHLMTALAEKSLIAQMVAMQKTIRELSCRLEAKK